MPSDTDICFAPSTPCRPRAFSAVSISLLIVARWTSVIPEPAIPTAIAFSLGTHVRSAASAHGPGSAGGGDVT